MPKRSSCSVLADLSVAAANAGRIAVAMQAARRIRANHPDLAVYGLITGPFTAGCDIVALVDPMTSHIGPEQFGEFVLPYAGDIVTHIHDRGHAQQNIAVMVQTGCGNISIDENIPLDSEACAPCPGGGDYQGVAQGSLAGGRQA